MSENLKRRLIVAAGLTIAAVAFTLFAGAATHGTVLKALAGPVCLWYGNAGVAVALSAGLSGPGRWPRDLRSRYIACANAAVIGLWIDGVGLTWYSLLTLPVFCTLERLTLMTVFPSDATGAYAPLRTWLEFIVSGELLGFALGLWISVLI